MEIKATLDSICAVAKLRAAKGDARTAALLAELGDVGKKIIREIDSALTIVEQLADNESDRQTVQKALALMKDVVTDTFKAQA
jgi:molybdenum-dependent DNA-binding transcriptional regulator ModE